MKSSEAQVNHISSTSPSFVLDDSLNVEGKYMCILRPNEELKPYYGEQPHKVIINPILSLDTPFSSWIGDLEVKWHTRSEAYYPSDHVYVFFTHEALKARLVARHKI